MELPAILVITDSPFTRKTVRRSLSEHGYPLIEAADTRTALSQLDVMLPGLVLQDLARPSSEQFGLAATLRARLGNDVPIVAMVGFISEVDEVRIAAAGFDDTIAKPIVARSLLQIVDAHVPNLASNLDRFGVGKRLLLADDDPLQLKSMCFRLERYGFEVTTAHDGVEALQLARRRAPDVIVADIVLRRLDGFGLSLAVRRDAGLCGVPVILVTGGVTEPSDHELACHAGASQLVVHTPDLDLLIAALRETLRRPVEALRLDTEDLRTFDRAHEQRMVRILDRQVSLNTGLGRRCSALGAELRVLAGVSENVLKQREIDPALEEALIACFDAGGIAMGALYLLQPDATLKVNAVCGEGRWSSKRLASFFGHESLLREIMASRVSTRFPSPAVPELITRELLTACQVSTMMIVPLPYLDKPVGALMMAGANPVDSDDLLAFAEGMAVQIAQVLALAKAFSDVSHARERAEQQASLLNALLLNAPDCVAHLGADGTVLFVSDVMRESQPHMIVGNSWLAAQRPEDREQARRAFETVISVGDPMSYESVVAAADGEPRCYSNRLGPVRRAGDIIGAMLVARDVSDKNKVEAQLLTSDRMASVGMLAASVAHEINNPLAAIMLSLELVHRDIERIGLEAGQVCLQKEVQNAQEAGLRVIQVVRDLSIFSRSRDVVTKVRVRGVLESSLRMAWNEIRHRAQLETDFADVPSVDGDESRLGQVFLNLLVNAAQAMPAGNSERNKLRVATCVDEQGRVLVTVSDTGPGIPEQHRAQLFRPFFTTKAEGLGTGLGLTICDRIVRSMDGSIGFDSELGKGTTFWVALPPSGSSTASSVRPPAPSARPTRRGRILIIDDDRKLGEVVARLLARDHDVQALTHARDALQLIAAEPHFDVILCDLMMPQMTGEGFFVELTRLQPQQAKRIVFMTGGPFTGTERDFLASVGNHYIHKPFDLQVLERMLTELVH
jgi:PAS domain S-box-containing protein